MANKMQRWFDLTAEDRCTFFAPIYHAAGLKANLLVPLLLGASIALPTSRHPANLPEWLSNLRPTWLTATPTFLQAALEQLRSVKRNELKHSLRFINSMTSYLPEAVRTELEAILGVPVLGCYGSSEAGMVAANPAPPAKRKPGTAGVISPAEVAIKDSNGELLPIGEVGEIIVRGPGVMPGYIDEANGVATAFGDGWLSTGDLGFIDSENFLTLVGRTNEIINRGGEKISPYEVEKILLLHRSVREAAAFSVPHPRLGENVAAAVVLHPGTRSSSSELRD